MKEQVDFERLSLRVSKHVHAFVTSGHSAGILTLYQFVQGVRNSRVSGHKTASERT